MMLSPLNNNYMSSPFGYTGQGKSTSLGNENVSGAQFPGSTDARYLPGSTDASRLPGNNGEDEKRVGKDPGEECQTCANRKYQDGSDEMVSFKSPKHVSPEAAATAVRAHEQEHVSNAYKKAAQENGEVISATVAIHTAICPECGRSYVSGGTTSTQIKYYNEENPYQQGLKTAESAKYAGMNVDYAL